MAKIEQRLSYTGDNVDFLYSSETVEKGGYDHIIHETKDGGTVIYPRSTTEEWDLDVICSESDVEKIRSWIENRRTVAFYENYTDSPGSSINTKIMNTEWPFTLWGVDQWRGTVQIREFI